MKIRRNTETQNCAGEQALPVVIYMLVGVIHTERLINGGALIHEPYRTSGVSGYVTDGEQSVKREKRGCSTV